MLDLDRVSPVPSRRIFLGGLAAAGLLAACGDDDASRAEPGSESDGGPPVGELSAVRFFGPFFPAGRPARAPFGLSDDDGLLPADRTPAQVVVRVVDPDGEELVSGQVVRRRAEGLPRPYYAVQFVPAAAGFHDVFLDTGSGEIRTQVQVVAADDPVASRVVAPGMSMPELITPTTEDPGAVDPVCTRIPFCDLHVHTVAEVIGSGRPAAVLVSTPAFCQTAVCGPILDLLLDLVPDHPDVDFVHLEVYRDPENISFPPAVDDFAPAIADLGLPFEPVLFTVGGDGIVVGRLDFVFDRSEMNDALDELAP